MDNTIRIAHIIGKWVGGGVEAVVMNYYKNIDRTKVQFDFICDEDSTNIPYDEIKKLGGRVILVPPSQKIFKYRKCLRRIFRENKYKIVHSHINTLSIFPLSAAKKERIPIRIAHSHSTTNNKEWKKNILKQLLKPFSKKYATHYMCCSELAGRWLFGNRVYDEGKVYLLNNAIDIKRFEYDEMIRKKKREELQIDKDTIVIGHIGRFVEQKNHKFLIDIFNEIHKEKENTILLLAGEGPLIEKMKEKVKSLKLDKCTKFLGQRKDANELYQAMDIFLLPSLYEGLPVVGVEAQAAGLLCILSDRITKDTKVLSTTKFIDINLTPKILADDILNNLKEFTRENTYKQLENKGFSIEKESEKLIKTYFDYLKDVKDKCN